MPTPHIADLITLANRLVNAGQRERARIVCEQAIAAWPAHPAVHQLLATLDLQAGESASALAHATLSLKLRPDHVPTLLLQGDALVDLGIVLPEAARLDEALRAYGRAYRLHEASFGRIAQALEAPGSGRAWLTPDDLRAALRSAGA